MRMMRFLVWSCLGLIWAGMMAAAEPTGVAEPTDAVESAEAVDAAKPAEPAVEPAEVSEPEMATGQAPEAGAAESEQIRLKTAEARLQLIDQEQVVDAVLEAVHQSTVSSQTSGRITEVLVDVDDYVNKGDIIVRFRDREQQAALRAAAAKAKEARSNFNRMQDLLQRKLISRAEYDRAEAALKAANAAREQAQEQLEHTVVRAPYSGIVVERKVEPGETANPGQPLMTGLSLEQLRAIAQVPQSHIVSVRKLARARVIFPTRNNSTVEADTLTISPYADPVTHTFNVRVELPEGQHGVYPGMFAKVAFVTGEIERLLIPAEAVVHRSEVTGIYVIKGEQISFRQIRVGRRLNDGQIEVLAGLDAGEMVALEPIRAGVMLKELRAGKDS